MLTAIHTQAYMDIEAASAHSKYTQACIDIAGTLKHTQAYMDIEAASAHSKYTQAYMDI